jgi:hypothetical protein
MRMAWKPDKAPRRKREQKERLERQQFRKDFAANMQRALQLFHEFDSGAKNVASFVSDVLDLEQKYVDWAIAKFRHERFKQPMNKVHQDMHDTWQEILTTAKACEKATEARIHAQGKKMHARACAAELERRELKRMQRDRR